MRSGYLNFLEPSGHSRSVKGLLYFSLHFNGNKYTMGRYQLGLYQLVRLISFTSFQVFWVCFCRLRYPVCKVFAPCGHLWSARVYRIFPNYLIKGKIFGEKVTENKTCVLNFSTTFAWNTSHYEKNSERYGPKYLQVFKQSTLYSSQVVMKV